MQKRKQSHQTIRELFLNTQNGIWDLQNSLENLHNLIIMKLKELLNWRKRKKLMKNFIRNLGQRMQKKF